MTKSKPILTFITGGHYFFCNMEGYITHDIDEINILDNFPKVNAKVLCIKNKEKDIFFIANLSKEDAIKNLMTSDQPMRIGKFLTREYSQHIGLTLNDLKEMSSIFDVIDKRHKYYKIIYDAYFENGDFVLTDEQRKKAFEEYKAERPETYKQ